MDFCPVCKAKYKQKEICYRCKADLSPILNIEALAEQIKLDAVKQFNQENYHAMLQLAKRSYLLVKTDEARQLFACAALLTGDFLLAKDLNFAMHDNPIKIKKVDI